MGVPKYIREVPRPTNTVVIDNGKDGPTRYAVRERNGVQYVSGGNEENFLSAPRKQGNRGTSCSHRRYLEAGFK